MLEAAAAARSIVRIAAGHGLTDAHTARDVFRRAHDGDERALLAVREEAARLAFVVASVAAVVDPELVVLAGGVGAPNTELLREPMARLLARTTPLAPRIAAAELGDDAVLTGAVATALRTAQDVVFARVSGY
jgi:predicted NBD/HSP70 family sugar kinase